MRKEWIDMKIFLSHKMNGLSEKEVMKLRKDAEDYLKSKYGDNIELIDNYNHENVPEHAGRLWHLGISITQMEEADAVYFYRGWESANGCRIERMICELYGLKIIE